MDVGDGGEDETNGANDVEEDDGSPGGTLLSELLVGKGRYTVGTRSGAEGKNRLSATLPFESAKVESLD
jgi:hypothetical protein